MSEEVESGKVKPFKVNTYLFRSEVLAGCGGGGRKVVAIKGNNTDSKQVATSTLSVLGASNTLNRLSCNTSVQQFYLVILRHFLFTLQLPTRLRPYINKFFK